MKLLFYSHTGIVSGAENIMLMILRRLNSNRYSTVTVCPEEGTLAESVTRMGLRCSPIGRLEARFTLRPDLLIRYLLSFIYTIRQLREEVVKHRPDLIHANSIRAGLVATIASYGIKVPVIWILQDALPFHPLSTFIRLFVLCSSRTRLMPASQATFDRFRGTLLKVAGKNIPVRVMHNAIELEQFQLNNRHREAVRTELGLPEDRFVFGIVGQITPRKGQLELVEAFAKTKRRMPSSTLLVVGEPMFNRDHGYLEQVKRRAKKLGLENDVRFLGMRKDVAAIMQAIDLLVINSKSEALVIVAIEAMACRTPILATDVGGTSEIIDHLKNGWLFESGDKTALSHALERLSNDPELRGSFALESRNFVIKRLTAEKYMRNLEEFYEVCAKRQIGEVRGNLAAEV